MKIICNSEELLYYDFSNNIIYVIYIIYKYKYTNKISFGHNALHMIVKKSST